MRTPIQTRAFKAGAVAAMVGIAPVLAACGSDAGGSGEEDTIKVLNYAPYDAAGFSLPGIKTAAQAGVDKVNEEGGINGRKLELITCDDKNDPNAAANCAREAVQEKVVAVLGGYSTSEAQVMPVLNKAKIPDIGHTSVSDFTSEMNFPFTGGAAGSFFGVAKAMATDPVCEGKVGIVIEDFAATQGVAKLFQLGVAASGAEFTGVSSAPQGARDFAPAVNAASEKAACIGFVAGPQTGGLIVTEAQKVSAIKKIGGSDSVFSVEDLGSAADGVIVVSSYLPLKSESSPEMKEFIERTEKIDSDFDPSQGAINAYLASTVLKEALKDSEEISASAVVAGLNKISGFDTGLGPVLDYTKENPTKAFSRLAPESPLYKLVAKGGAYEIASEEPIDVSNVYEAAASAGQ